MGDETSDEAELKEMCSAIIISLKEREYVHERLLLYAFDCMEKVDLRLVVESLLLLLLNVINRIY
jgi:hypothetical protein